VFVINDVNHRIEFSNKNMLTSVTI